MNKNAGLFQKYTVTKTDGTPVDPQAVYFVLRLDTDSSARTVTMIYSGLIRRENPKLSKDIRELLEQIEKEIQS